MEGPMAVPQHVGDGPYSQLEVLPEEFAKQPQPQHVRPQSNAGEIDRLAGTGPVAAGNRKRYAGWRKRWIPLVLSIFIVCVVVGGAIGGVLGKKSEGNLHGGNKGGAATSLSPSPSTIATMFGTATALASYTFPTPVTFGYPNMSVFAISEDRSVRYKWRTLSQSGDEVWNPTDGTLQDLGGIISNAQDGVCAVCRTNGTVDLFVLYGNDTQMWRKYWNSTDWSPWMNTDSGLEFATAPGGASMDDDGRIDLFAIGTDFQLHTLAAGLEIDTTYGSGSHGGNWSIVQPTVISRAESYLDIFLIGPNDHALYHQFYRGDGFRPTPWTFERLGGFCTSRPAAVGWNGSVDVFVRGGDAGLWHIGYTQANDNWSAWSSIGGGTLIQGEPDAVSWGPGRIDVFAWGADASLLHKSYDGTRWTPDPGFEDLNVTLGGPPKAVSDQVGSVHVFGYSSLGRLIHKAWNETTKSWAPGAGFQDLGTP